MIYHSGYVAGSGGVKCVVTVLGQIYEMEREGHFFTSLPTPVGRDDVMAKYSNKLWQLSMLENYV